MRTVTNYTFEEFLDAARRPAAPWVENVTSEVQAPSISGGATFADAAEAAIRDADALRTALGPYTPSYRVLQQLRELRLDPGSVEAQMYLYIAGPYVPRGD